MQAENPLDAYMVKCGVIFDAEIGNLVDELEIDPNAGLSDFCLMVGGEDDFTAAVDRRMSKVFPGFYSLKYIGWGLTAIYVFWGERWEVLEKLDCAAQRVRDDQTRKEAEWADPTTWKAAIATQIGPFKLMSPNVNLGLDMGYIRYQDPTTDLINGIEVRRYEPNWIATQARSYEDGGYEDKEVGRDEDVAVLTSRLAASWGPR